MQQFGEFFLNHWDLFLALVVILGMLSWQMFGGRIRGFRDVEPLEAVRLMNRDEAVLVDVREEAEMNDGFVAGSVHVPLSKFGDQVGALDESRGKPIIVGCRSGHRSARAAGMLRKRGFEPVYNLRGGMMAWQGANLPLTKPGKRKKKK